MSLEASRKRIVCDSSDCSHNTRLPISLSSLSADDSSASRQQSRSSAAGWLFVRGEYEMRHYCPDCRPKIVR
jgi:hypothetical protein